MINSKLTEEVFNTLFQQPKNKLCFECSAQSSQWASVNNGIFLCLQCSGKHRGLGVNVSFVRSVGMDTWSQKQLDMMLQGGNEKLQAFFDSYNIPKEAPIDFKFKTKAAIYYREMLKCVVEGVPVPEPPNQEEALELVDFSNPDFKMQTPQPGMGNVEEEEVKDSDDPLDQVKGFFISTFNKTKEVGKQAYEKSTELAKEAQEKVEHKYNDPEFQNNMKDFKEKVSTGAHEIGEKGTEYAQKGYKSLKSGITSAWSFFKQKAEEIQQIQEQPQQQNQQMNNNEDNDDITLENNDQTYQKQ